MAHSNLSVASPRLCRAVCCFGPIQFLLVAFWMRNAQHWGVAAITDLCSLYFLHNCLCTLATGRVPGFMTRSQLLRHIAGLLIKLK